jgi:hypothetical protein
LRAGTLAAPPADRCNDQLSSPAATCVIKQDASHSAAAAAATAV